MAENTKNKKSIKESVNPIWISGTSSHDYDQYKKRFLETIKADKSTKPLGFYSHNITGSTNTIRKEIKKKKEDIENEDLAQNIRLKKHTLYVLFGFLAVETIAIFSFSFFQATYLFKFDLEEWSFKLLVTATILQITFMIQVAVKHLFPNHFK